MRGGCGGCGGVKIIVTTAHSPPSTPTGTETSVGQMLGTQVCGLGSGGQWWINGDKKFGCDANKRGPGGSKGDTEGPCVSLPNHCVALWGTSGHGGDLRETKT